MNEFHRFTILVVDDDVYVRNLLRGLLEKDYEVLTAADGAEGLEMSRAHKGTIDLLLTDEQMPRLDGPSLYRQICMDRPPIKVLFISGRPPVERTPVDQSLPFLPKPFGGTTLLTRVREILGKSESKVILVVDSDAARLDRTTGILTRNGYVVHAVSSGQAAEAVSGTVAKIDLIVAAVGANGDSGIQLAERVEASERNISTLLISHFDSALLRGMPGFSRQPEFLGNPFTPEALLSRVERLLKEQE